MMAGHRTPSNATMHAEAERIRQLEQELRAVYASTSWRITKPLRWLSRLLRSPSAALAELPRVAQRVLRRLSSAPVAQVEVQQQHAHPQQAHPETVLPAEAPAYEYAALPVYNRDNVIGPAFATLLLAELDAFSPLTAAQRAPHAAASKN